ncbi:uncharacterized protein [Miscanthus floridulus]|uniref:uncharacterized protein n=1 Tax=Miscanthus floridulus TaxID=154761 RepID=UPI003457D8F8
MAGDIVVIEADPWDPSDVTVETLKSLIDGGLLRPMTDPNRPEWIALYGEPEPRPRDGYIGMRDVRSSPPPVPEDTRRRAINRAHADAQKKQKDAKVAKRTKKILAREELDKRRRQQRKDGLLLEESLSPSLLMEAVDRDDEGEVAEVQAALQHGAASARADPKEPTTPGGAAEVALTQEGEVASPPHDGEARGSDAAEVPLATETTRTEVPGVSQAGATETAAPETIEAAATGTGALATAEATMAEAGAPETTEAMMAEAGAPETTEATMAEAGAPGTTDADAIVAGLPAQEMEMKAAKALAAPLVQGPPPLRESAREVEILPISSDDTSRA